MAEIVVAEVGKKLSQPRLNKDSVVKLLKEAEAALQKLHQSPSLKTAIKPLNKSLSQSNLLHNKDKEIRLLVTACFSEIIRILAPDPLFSDEIFKGIFKLIVATFADLADSTSPYFPRRMKILKDVAALECCVRMLDIGCDNLVLEMFRIFFSVIKEDHQQVLFNYMLSIMTVILKGTVSQPLVDVILHNLLQEDKGASFRLATATIDSCAGVLEPFIRDFLLSCIMERDVSGNDLKRFYHRIIVEVYGCSPQMLISVIPYLSHELLADQVDVRLDAVHLIGELLVLSKYEVCQQYRALYMEFLRRFSDKSTDVRIATIECAKACYLAKPFGSVADDILTALEGRLLDFEDKVRTHAVVAVCSLARANLACFRSKLVVQAAERLRDKKASVRRTALLKLLELYRDYCKHCSEGLLDLSNDYEQIPCKILFLCFDKDCIEYRPESMEMLLQNELFPPSLSVQDKAKHWVAFSSHFSVPHTKALNLILAQKSRMHHEMKTYLVLRETEKENSSVEVQTRISTSFMKMSASFANSARANEGFQQLHQMKDKTVFKLLHELLNEYSSSSAIKSVRSALLERIGKKRPNFEFFNTLSLKISYSIFNAEHVYNIFEGLVSRDDDKSTLSADSALDLLLILLSKFPELVRGSWQLLLKLLTSQRVHSSEKLLQILAKAGSHVAVSLSDAYPFLEPFCLEGKRNQSKHAVSAICALWDGSDEINISGLYKKLLESLHSGHNLPTVMQSLGCLSICSLSTFELYQEQVTEFLYEKLSCSEVVDLPSEATSLIDEQCSTICKLKIYVLKALAKCYMPKQAAHLKHQIKKFLDCLIDIMEGKGTMQSLSSSESDQGHLRLAAAKSVLQLAKRWDSHISPILFRLTVMVAKDPCSAVRKAFLSKIHRLLKEHVIPSRYAIAFALATSDTLAEIRNDSLQYFHEFLKEHRKEVLLRQNILVHGKDGRNMTQYPEYIVVFLIHVLAHDKGFPSESCLEEDIYAEFCSPLIVALRALTDPGMAKVEEKKINESHSYMLGIFRAIKKAEDAVDSHITPRLHILSNIGFYTLKTSKYYKHSTQSPHLILLPSSLYKLQREAGNLEIYSHNDSSIDEGFVMRVVSIVDADAKPGCSGSKKYRSSRRDLQQLNSTKSKPTHNLVGGHADVSLDKKSDSSCGVSAVVVHQTNTSRRKEMKALPVCSLHSIKPAGTLVNSKTMLEDTDDNLGKISNVEEEKSSSMCGSASTKPSYPTPELVEEESHTASTPLATCQVVINNSGLGLQDIETSKICSQTSADRKRPADTGKLQIGQRIRLSSLQDKCVSSGIVDVYDSQSSDCQIVHDKGERFYSAREKLDGIHERPALEDKTNFYPKDCSFSRKHPISVSSTATLSENVQESNIWSVSSSGSHTDDVTSTESDSQEPLVNLEKKKEKACSKRIISTETVNKTNKRSLRSSTRERSLEAEPVRRTRARRA